MGRSGGRIYPELPSNEMGVAGRGMDASVACLLRMLLLAWEFRDNGTDVGGQGGSSPPACVRDWGVPFRYCEGIWLRNWLGFMSGLWCQRNNGAYELKSNVLSLV
ncbi:hypothetical protein AVEN_60171-1 [Araneus ventricosus]|uniref:Uncharacterized protein n=1 Tax=Araneus ventricosus TaxID=182803 RepID=A0A4Y2SUT8_ARAVE|nr:hypothetical protein AVEN_188155-1 [Araneus ventricosus]GBN92098.1 hypothetical protein AVEN_155431-1 [Araneus ventricosus]GBN92215.1 hypothetical protein AVEN_468-1 [Araneus ventricosus]GBN92217.1 hypothetical protein AVEN_60171-1 [Araneus ventricosus]